MPALSPTMEKGTLAKWRVAEGAELAPGDVIADVETDKATVDFEVTDGGFLAKKLVADGASDVPVGTTVAILVENAGDVAAFAGYAAPTGGAGAPAPPPPVAAPPPTPAHSSHASSHTSSSSSSAALALPAHAVFPSARLLMAAAGMHPSAVGTGTGKDGRITKGDVLAAGARGGAPSPQPAVVAAAVAAPVAAPAPAGPRGVPARGYTDTKPSTIRKVIAARLTESKSRIPHAYAVMDIRIDALLALRASLKEGGVAVSVNDMVVKGVALSLRDVPAANAHFDVKKGEVVSGEGVVDVCVAVATEGGLLTPIIKGAGGLSLSAINDVVKDLAARARIGKLKPEEFQGGSFTVSNLGMFGIDEFTAVINPPQVRRWEGRARGGAPASNEPPANSPPPPPHPHRRASWLLARGKSGWCCRPSLVWMTCCPARAPLPPPPPSPPS